MSAAVRFTPALKPGGPWSAGNLLTDLDLTKQELIALLDLTAKMKRTPARYCQSAQRALHQLCCSRSRRCGPGLPSNWRSSSWAGTRWSAWARSATASR